MTIEQERQRVLGVFKEHLGLEVTEAKEVGGVEDRNGFVYTAIAPTGVKLFSWTIIYREVKGRVVIETWPTLFSCGFGFLLCPLREKITGQKIQVRLG